MQLPNSIFKVSFQASLSLRKFQGAVLQKVRAEEKESKNLFAVIRAEEKEKSTHHSSRKSRQKLSAVAAGERREEEKKEEWKRWRHHSNHQSYVCEKSNKTSNNYCKY